MVLISTRILMAEQVSKRQLLPTSVSRGWAPIALPSWKSLQDQLVGLTQAPFKVLPLPWVSGWGRFCVPLFRVETFLQLSWKKAPEAFNVNYSGDSPSWCMTPTMEARVGLCKWNSGSSPKRNLVPINSHSHSVSLQVCLFWMFCRNRIMKYVVFCDWLTSFSMFSKCVHIKHVHTWI